MSIEKWAKLWYTIYIEKESRMGKIVEKTDGYMAIEFDTVDELNEALRKMVLFDKWDQYTYFGHQCMEGYHDRWHKSYKPYCERGPIEGIIKNGFSYSNYNYVTKSSVILSDKPYSSHIISKEKNDELKSLKDNPKEMLVKNCMYYQYDTVSTPERGGYAEEKVIVFMAVPNTINIGNGYTIPFGLNLDKSGSSESNCIPYDTLLRDNNVQNNNRDLIAKYYGNNYEENKDTNFIHSSNFDPAFTLGAVCYGVEGKVEKPTLYMNLKFIEQLPAEEKERRLSLYGDMMKRYFEIETPQNDENHEEVQKQIDEKVYKITEKKSKGLTHYKEGSYMSDFDFD